MRIFILIIAWIHRYEIARFLGRACRVGGEFFRRLSKEKEAERAQAQDYAGPHGGFDANSRRPF